MPQYPHRPAPGPRPRLRDLQELHRRPDVVSWGDLAIIRCMRMLYRKRTIDPAFFRRLRKRYSPYGTTASLYLWAIACGSLPELTDPAAKRAPEKKRGAVHDR